MKKICILFGGRSTEHNISIVSATSIIYNLDKEKYDIYPVYISKEGLFYKYNKNIKDIKVLTINDTLTDLEYIDNIIDYFKTMDIVFPVLHGKNGEDGTIQGMLELLDVKYVGCKVLSSSICMDKVYTKSILNLCGIEQTKYMVIKKYKDNYIFVDNKFNEKIISSNELIKRVKEYLNFPVFIKPSRQGSSIGINKSTIDNFIEYLEYAFEYDDKVILEENIVGREVECAILGNDNLIISEVGEIKSADNFYSFDSKYKNKKSITIIPAEIDKTINDKIKNIAKHAYKACDCSSLSRIDFFIENNTNRIILNEINTMPGFTEISMYPKLIENMGISYKELLDRLIEL